MPRSKAKREPATIDPRTWRPADILLTVMGAGVLLMVLGATWVEMLVVGTLVGWTTLVLAMFVFPPCDNP